MTINNREIDIKEYNNKRVVTFRDIDYVHGRPEGTARKRFNDNKIHFIEGEDYFKVKCSEVRPFFGQTIPNGFNPKADMVLITESGYLMLVKSFTDDLSWKVQRQLVNNYFRGTETKQHLPTRPLTTDDYLEASRTVAKCHNSRLPIVLDLLEKAGLDIKRVKNEAVEAAETDDVDLVNLLNQFTLQELLERLPICKTSIYYYRIGKYTPRQERREEIIRILGG